MGGKRFPTGKGEMARKHAELPFGDEMIGPALIWAARHRKYSTDDLKAALAEHYGLTPAQLALELPDGRLAFSNYVDWLTANLTQRGMHRGGNKTYELTERGRRAAARVKVGDPAAGL